MRNTNPMHISANWISLLNYLASQQSNQLGSLWKILHASCHVLCLLVALRKPKQGEKLDLC